jgi:hypothetical protein
VVPLMLPNEVLLSRLSYHTQPLGVPRPIEPQSPSNLPCYTSAWRGGPFTLVYTFARCVDRIEFISKKSTA